jgi:hypothetical protein
MPRKASAIAILEFRSVILRRLTSIGIVLCWTIQAVGAAAAPYEAIGKYDRNPSKPALQGTVDPALTARYQQAVEDAQIAEWGESATNLTAIRPQTAGLIWDNDGATTRVLLVTWTSWTGYDAMVGTTTTLSRDAWMTPVPEIKDFCTSSGLAGDGLVLRLEQALGLPPNNGKTRFVEMWADPDDLFRPSADPEITDREATPDYPRSTRYVTVSPAHVTWMNNLIASSYGPDGYPWTRLGYTYDWGNDTTEQGFSEFVIAQGAVVKIHSVTLTADYRQPLQNSARAWRRYP